MLRDVNVVQPTVEPMEREVALECLGVVAEAGIGGVILRSSGISHASL